MSFAHYLLQVNLYLIVFYGFYKLLLDKETYFTLNRIYLVAAGFLSLLIPFIRLEWLTVQKAAQQVYTTVKWDAVLEKATIVADAQEGFNWANLVVSIYCAGILFFLFRLIINLLFVKRLLKNVKQGSAFSFFGKKIIDISLPNRDVIDSHEEAHIKQWHSLDVLFFEVVGILTWLNPVIYFYKKSIKNIHEFLADEHAANYQGDKTEYAMLILSKSFGINQSTLTSNFFEKSLVKKRIYMLHKERSKKTAVVKYGIFIPLFAISIVFSSATIRKNENLLSFAEQIPLDKPIDLVEELVIKPLKIVTPEKTKTVAKHAPITNNWEDFYSFLSKNIKYPQNAQQKALEGTTHIMFTVKNGKITDLGSKQDLGEGCDEEVMKNILAYKNFKNVKDGNYAFKVSFNLGQSQLNSEEQSQNIDGYKEISSLQIIGYVGEKKEEEVEKTEKVYDFVSIEKQPEYHGGMKNFYDYLSKSIKYPEDAQANNVQGKVHLSFTVEKNGKLTDIKIVKGLSESTNDEAARVLNQSPNWIPGIQNGKPVRVKYNLFINFTLDSSPKLKSASPESTRVSFKGIQNLNSSANSPLVVLDGVTQGKDALKFIRTESIESISVLRDEAATMLYGTKGVNGVILITSKVDKNNSFKSADNKISSN
ncbi:TonB family protein [Pedobacter aquatilis]|uniref:M56 family metallopeptidase protein n=1 Tax=Pedobacter aquatilis TaxID=351343 RepID=UPI0025B40F92|nr:M56 family metallopeptidase protein [Pedobacter aquatilis]MDN3587470.1 TonB family protein [Pedobacter aquatilis]